MANIILSRIETAAGAQPTSDVVGLLWIPENHRLLAARFTSLNIAQTGTLSATLKRIHPGGSFGGLSISDALGNDELAPAGVTVANTYRKVNFVLNQSLFGAFMTPSLYYVLINGSDSADRIDYPGLEIEYAK